MSRYREELSGAPKARCPKPWPIWPVRKSVTGCHNHCVYFLQMMFLLKQRFLSTKMKLLLYLRPREHSWVNAMRNLTFISRWQLQTRQPWWRWIVLPCCTYLGSVQYNQSCFLKKLYPQSI